MKPRRPPNPTQAIADVQAVYADLAARPVERDCLRRTECCQFKLTGRTPYLTKGEALTAAKALRKAGQHRVVERPDGACPMLGPQGHCLIYADRPFGCRTHFCQAAGGPYARREVIDLIHRLEDIDSRTGGDGPRTIYAAITAAFREV